MAKLLLAGQFHPDVQTLLAGRPDVDVEILVEPTEQQLIDASPGSMAWSCAPRHLVRKLAPRQTG